MDALIAKPPDFYLDTDLFGGGLLDDPRRELLAKTLVFAAETLLPFFAGGGFLVVFYDLIEALFPPSSSSRAALIVDILPSVPFPPFSRLPKVLLMAFPTALVASSTPVLFMPSMLRVWTTFSSG